jgi:succinate dehydrogenase / fumarate reductase cytochrome b subunit
MGLTGISLVLFLIVHSSVNGMIFFNDNGETFNTYAHFLSHNFIMRFIEIGLFVGLFLHIIQGFVLWRKNDAARPTKYEVKPGNSTSKWYSRSMGILGSLLLIFLVVHLSQFWLSTKNALYITNNEEHNLYTDMMNAFQQEWIVAVYLVGVVAMFWHLVHGFPSAFQSLGINNPKYNSIIKTVGWIYSLLVCGAFALMPLAFYFHWIQ